MWLAKVVGLTASVVLGGATIMGAAQSTRDLKIVCNCYVAQFVQERAVLVHELIGRIKIVADVESCKFSGNDYFIVTIKKRTSKQQTEEILKSIIQDFFSSFTTCVTHFDSSFYHEINSDLGQQSSHKIKHIFYSGASIRLTGYKEAVNSAVKSICLLQKSTDSRTVDDFSNSSYGLKKKSASTLPSTQTSIHHVDHYKQSACSDNTPCSSGQLQSISSPYAPQLLKPTKENSSTTLVSNPQLIHYEQSASEESTPSSCEQEELAVSSYESELSNFIKMNETYDDQTPSYYDSTLISRWAYTSANYHLDENYLDDSEEYTLSSESDQTSDSSSEDISEDDIEETNQEETRQDAKPLLNADEFLGERIQDTLGCFIVVAKNKPVARCIMMSQEHMVTLRQIFVCFAQATVKYHQTDNRSILVYSFQRKQKFNIPRNELLSEYCEEKLISFLSGFKSKFKFFKLSQWNEAFQKDSTYFTAKQRPGESLKVNTKWYKNKLLVAGLSNDVDGKVEEITKHLHELVPPVYPYQFCKPVENQHVGLFLLERHKLKIKNDFKHLANATVKKQDGNIVIQFNTTKPISKQCIPNFETNCEDFFDEVLEQYSSGRHNIPKELLTEIQQQHKYIFDNTEDILVISQDPYVLSGTKQEVENRLQEVLKIMCENKERKKCAKKQMFADLSETKKQRKHFLYLCNQNDSGILNFIANHDCCEQLLEPLNHFGEVKFDHPDDNGIHRMLVTFYKVYQGANSQVLPAIRCLFKKFAIKQIEMEISQLRKIHLNESGLFSRKNNDPSAKVFASFDQTGKVFVVGFKADVQKRLKDINEARMQITSLQGRVKEIPHSKTELQKEFEKAFSQEEANVLECCGIIDEIRTSCKEMTISMGNGSLQLKGSPQMVDKAKCILDKKLVKTAPLISGKKLDYFEVFSKNSPENAEKALKAINAKVLKSNLKGVLMYESGKLVLVSSDENSYSDISKEIEGMLFETKLTIAKNQLKLLSDSSLLEIVAESLKSNVVAKLDENGGFILLVCLDELILKNTEKKLKSFFIDHQITKIVCECPKQFVSFCIKQSLQDKTFPNGVTMTLNKSGCIMNGSWCKVTAAQGIFQDIKGKIKMVEKVITRLCFWAFMHSTEAISVLTSAEEKFGCQIKLMKDKTTEDKSRNSTSPKPAKNSCSYGNFMLQVYRGDITTQDCDVIINHCNQDYDLNWGTVSKAILRKAGRSMQVELDASKHITCFCKVTKGLGLPCKNVVHVKSPTSLKELVASILDALMCSEKKNARSVAIPTLGAGGIGFEKNNVASAFAEALEEFNRRLVSSRRSVNSIKVVVYDATLLPTFLLHLIYSKTFSANGEMNLRMAESKLNNTINRDVEVAILHCKDKFQFPQLENFLYNRVMEALSSEEFCHEAFSRFGNHEWIDIYQKATVENVQLTQSSWVDRKRKVLLLGMPEGVGRVKEFLKELVFEFQQSELSAEKWVWQWSATQANFKNFAPRISSAIEVASKKTLKQSEVAFEGSKSLIDFSQLTFTCDGCHGFLRRKIVHLPTALSLPCEWNDMQGNAVRRNLLKKTSAEYRRVERLVFASKPPLRITGIERIQNTVLYRHYVTQKESIADHVTNGNPVERELFHGTSCEDAAKICKQGFDKGFLGKNATAFGNGNYFAVDSKYAMMFATPNRSGQSERSIILAQVLTGDFCQGCSGMKAPPAKLASAKSGRLHDSVVNDPTNPTIFVVFKDASSYPAYLIKFLPTG